MKLLLRSGADPDPRSGYGLTPLALAAQIGHTEIMELLLQKGETLLYRIIHLYIYYISCYCYRKRRLGVGVYLVSFINI